MDRENKIKNIIDQFGKELEELGTNLLDLLSSIIEKDKKLSIAIEALDDIRKNYRYCDTNHCDTADDALEKIKEIENASH